MDYSREAFGDKSLEKITKRPGRNSCGRFLCLFFWPVMAIPNNGILYIVSVNTTSECIVLPMFMNIINEISEYFWMLWD